MDCLVPTRLRHRSFDRSFALSAMALRPYSAETGKAETLGGIFVPQVFGQDIHNELLGGYAAVDGGLLNFAPQWSRNIDVGFYVAFFRLRLCYLTLCVHGKSVCPNGHLVNRVIGQMVTK